MMGSLRGIRQQKHGGDFSSITLNKLYILAKVIWNVLGSWSDEKLASYKQQRRVWRKISPYTELRYLLEESKAFIPPNAMEEYKQLCSVFQESALYEANPEGYVRKKAPLIYEIWDTQMNKTWSYIGETVVAFEMRLFLHCWNNVGDEDQTLFQFYVRTLPQGMGSMYARIVLECPLTASNEIVSALEQFAIWRVPEDSCLNTRGVIPKRGAIETTEIKKLATWESWCARRKKAKTDERNSDERRRALIGLETNDERAERLRRIFAAASGLKTRLEMRELAEHERILQLVRERRKCNNIRKEEESEGKY
jgi:hypothetical protein